MLDFFHCLGKLLSFRHLLYTSVRKDGKFPKTHRSISLVSLSSPGAFLGLKFFYHRCYFFSREGFIVFSVYQFLYLLPNLLVNCTVICFVVFGNKILNICFVVVSVSKVKVPSGCWRVVKQVVLPDFPEAVL
jgi:hypothetical protein